MVSAETKFYLAVGGLLVLVVVAALWRNTVDNPRPADAPAVAGVVLGKDSAPVKVDYYFDFACSHCQAASPLLLAAYQAYPDDIQIAFFPVSGIASQLSSQAMVCAGQQKNFLPVYESLMARQGNASQQDVNIFVEQAGLKIDKFGECLTDGATGQQLTSYVTAAAQRGITQVPTLFVNGQSVSWQNIGSELERAVNLTP